MELINSGSIIALCEQAEFNMRLTSLIGSIKLLLLLLIFIIDLQLPLGIAAGTPYALVVLFTLRSENNMSTSLVAIASIIFTIIGYFLSPQSTGSAEAAIINRALAVFIITASAILVMRNHRDRESIRALTVLSTTDKLTTTKNRLAFDEAIESEVARAARYHRPLSLALIDVDHFKTINDRYGHDVGDQTLVEVAELIHNVTRASDRLYRLGGDEFAILLSEIKLETAQFICEKIRKAFDSQAIQEKSLTPTLSIGIATFQENDSKDTLFKRADEALYLSKKNGRNCVTGSQSAEADLEATQALNADRQ